MDTIEYRQIWPAQALHNYHDDNVHVDILLQTPVTEDDLGKYDIVHFHRRINTQEDTLDWIKRFQNSGAIVVADIDDYWIPFDGHPAKNLVVKNRLHVQIVETLRAVDWITTTTSIFAEYIRKAVKHDRIHIIPNAVDTNKDVWKPKDVESDRVRVAWIGGSSHERDLNRIEGTFNKLFSDPEVAKKIQVVMCGYDTRGTMTEFNPITKEEKTRKITPEESVWNKFENIFSDYGRADKDQYVRRNTLPITKYGLHYNYCDVCLAPLDQHTFNECKSELKIIETGIMGKALIASDLYIYHELLTHGENAMLVNPRKDHKEWAKYIRQVVLDDDLRLHLAKNLREFVYPQYTLEEVTKNRMEWYKGLCDDKERKA